MHIATSPFSRWPAAVVEFARQNLESLAADVVSYRAIGSVQGGLLVELARQINEGKDSHAMGDAIALTERLALESVCNDHIAPIAKQQIRQKLAGL